MKIYWKREDASVVSSVEEQTEQAAALARIGGQELLIDPRTNPAVRSFATELRDSRHRKILKADDRRDLRKIRVEENRAEHAEKALESLQQAREASSPAKSVRALYASRTRYMHVSLATSIVLAFGSARGLEHLTTKYESIPAGSGYIAEVGLTGLATIVILAKSELSQHGGKIKRWQDVALWSLMVAPLVASMVANVHGGNIIGATCAAGAAAFAFFSYIVADTFASSARQQASMVTGDDESDLRKIASGEDLFSAPAAEVPTKSFSAGSTGEQTPMSSSSGHQVDTAMTTPVGELTPSVHPTEPTSVATPGPTPMATLVTTAGPTPLGLQKPTPVPTGDHIDSGHRESTGKPMPIPAPAAEHKAEPTGEPSPVVTTDPATSQPNTNTGGKAKRRTRDQIRTELQKALKEHYDNGGGEPQVKPLAEAIRVNRRIVRELLDEMNVRPMVRKAVGQ